jgi:mannose-1-phosphate guanylyltransferase/phosphomannomutase
MKAVIMAGGEGSRLRPLTSNQQKAMIPMANRPMMEHIIRLLKDHGFDELVITVAFMANNVRTYFGDGSEFGVSIQYATEETPLGTAGSVRNAKDELDERFLVIAGDVITDIDLSAIVRFHEEKGAVATIGLKSMEDPLEFGIVITNEDGSIERFLEKPTWGQVFSDTINTGIYVLEPEIFDYIDGDRAVDFSGEVFPALLDAGRPLFGYSCEGYWEDVGTLAAYGRAHQDVLDGKVDLHLPGFGVGEGVWVGEGSEIDPSATIEGPVIIGDNCRIGAGAEVREYTVLGSNVRVGRDASLHRAVVHDNSYLAAGVRLRGTVVGRSCDLRQGARCEEGVVLGEKCFVGEHAVINPSVKVYPFKTVEPGAIINSSIVWESRGASHLFSRLGVRGLANVDLTPELALKLAMAYATTLKKGATVTASRDTSRAARTIKRAVMVGLNAAGVNVDDLEVAPIPATRFQVRTDRTQGGVTVRLSVHDPQQVVIRFFDDDGTDVGEDGQRKIERLFFREDFRRALAAEIGDIDFPPRAIEYYSGALTRSVDLSAIKAKGFKVVLDYAYGSASFVMPNVLAKLGADVLALNPYAATAGAVAFDRWQHAASVAEVVRASGSHLGAVIDPHGEIITLIDDSGHVLTDGEALTALLSLVLSTTDKATVAVPVSASRAVEELCQQAGAQIVWSKAAGAHLMEVVTQHDVTFAASQEGGYIFPDFLPAYDAIATLVHLLALLSETGLRLSKVVAQQAPVHIVHETIDTPWERKGMLMRSMVERAGDENLVLVDGMKVLFDDGWALVLPDPDEPLTHVWAEGPDDDAARSRADDYLSRIKELLG